jgi:hypothetical protein
MPWSDTAKRLQHWQEVYRTNWKYFATDDWVEFEGKKSRGLKLPPTVLRKLYHDNAARWVPGI